MVELVPSGANILVTQVNKREYVNAYMDWLFQKSVEPLFESFKKGFYKLYSGEFTTSCDTEELQLMICGSPVLDFKELERVTKYDGGYTKDHPTVRYFPSGTGSVETCGTFYTSSILSRRRSSSFSRRGATGRRWADWGRWRSA